MKFINKCMFAFKFCFSKSWGELVNGWLNNWGLTVWGCKLKYLKMAFKLTIIYTYPVGIWFIGQCSPFTISDFLYKYCILIDKDLVLITFYCSYLAMVILYIFADSVPFICVLSNQLFLKVRVLNFRYS